MNGINLVVLIVVGAGVLLVYVVWPVFLITLTRWEKQMIHCFELCAEPEPEQQSAYTQAMNKAGGELGLVPCGWYRHCRGGGYQATATLWVSLDCLTLVVISGGKMVGIPVKMTFLYSKAYDGLALLTSDDSGRLDISDMTDKQLLVNADLAELYDLHLQRLEIWDEPKEPFNESAVLKDFEQLEAKRVDRLVQLGLARYADYSQNVWRYTLKGAIQIYRCQRASWKIIKEQSERVSLKRPGDM